MPFFCLKLLDHFNQRKTKDTALIFSWTSHIFNAYWSEQIFVLENSVVNDFIHDISSGPREGGRRTMTPEPMDFSGPTRGLMGFRGAYRGARWLQRPSRRPMGFRGPIKMILRSMWETEDLCFLEIISKS